MSAAISDHVWEVGRSLASQTPFRKIPRPDLLGYPRRRHTRVNRNSLILK